MPRRPDKERARGEPAGGQTAAAASGVRGAIVVAAVCVSVLALVILTRRVGTVKDGEAPATAELPDMRLDLNAAALHDLRELPGVGPALAERIIAHRDEHGPFASIDELDAVPGVGEKTIERLRPLLIVK